MFYGPPQTCLWVFDKARFKPFSSATETSYKNEILLVASLDMILSKKWITRVKKSSALTLCLRVSSAETLCKQFELRSGPTESRSWSGSKLFDTKMVFLKELFEKIDFEKIQQRTKIHEKISQEAKS